MSTIQNICVVNISRPCFTKPGDNLALIIDIFDPTAITEEDVISAAAGNRIIALTGEDDQRQR